MANKQTLKRNINEANSELNRKRNKYQNLMDTIDRLRAAIEQLTFMNEDFRSVGIMTSEDLIQYENIWAGQRYNEYNKWLYDVFYYECIGNYCMKTEQAINTFSDKMSELINESYYVDDEIENIKVKIRKYERQLEDCE